MRITCKRIIEESCEDSVGSMCIQLERFNVGRGRFGLLGCIIGRNGISYFSWLL